MNFKLMIAAGLMAVNLSTVAGDKAPDRWDPIAEKTDFNCADKIAHLLPFLGRGPDFPKFLIMDLEFSLDRQIAGSRIKELHCMGEPQVETTSSTVDTSGNDFVENLTVAFPVEFVVSNAMETEKKKADLIYVIKNVNSEGPKKVSFSVQFGQLH